MNLANELLKEFSKVTTEPEKKKEEYAYGTAVVNGDQIYVRLDGSSNTLTPVSNAVDVETGHRVMVLIRNHIATITSNISVPTDASKALSIAAQRSAEAAADAATAARESADNAQQSADDAMASAVRANNHANDALTQLSIVEDVSGTLDWISEHGTYVRTTDTEVKEGMIYFYYNGDYVPIASPDPDAVPVAEGWYVLNVSDSQSDYIMAHLAVTSAGLWVVPSGQWREQRYEHYLVDGEGNYLVDSNGNRIVDYSTESDPDHSNGYKVLLSGTHMAVYNNEGSIVAKYGETITVGNASYQNVYIDSDSVDIRDGEVVLATFGSTVRIGQISGQNVYIDTTSIKLGSASDNITINPTSVSLMNDELDVGALDFSHYSDDENLVGITLHLGYNSGTRKPSYIGLSADDSSGVNNLKWIYLQPGTSMTGWAADMLNAGCSIDMNGFAIFDAAQINLGGSGSGYYINGLTSSGSLIGLNTNGAFQIGGNLTVNGASTVKNVTMTGQLTASAYPLYKIFSYTWSNQTFTGSTDLEVSYTVSGPYTVVGIVYIDSNHNHVGTIGEMWATNTGAKVSITNRGSTGYTDLSVTIRILAVLTSAYSYSTI